MLMDIMIVTTSVCTFSTLSFTHITSYSGQWELRNSKMVQNRVIVSMAMHQHLFHSQLRSKLNAWMYRRLRQKWRSPCFAHVIKMCPLICVIFHTLQDCFAPNASVKTFVKCFWTFQKVNNQKVASVFNCWHRESDSFVFFDALEWNKILVLG